MKKMNNLITAILVLVAIIITMGAVIYVLIKRLNVNKNKIENLECKLSCAKENISQLSAYIDKINKIKADEKSVSQQIQEAKSDEEVFNIIANIVSDNNSRVQND